MRDKKQTFYGSTTLGEKGQVVIPIEAREAMKMAKGQKLLAFGMGEDMLFFAKPEAIEAFTNRLNERVGELTQALRQGGE